MKTETEASATSTSIHAEDVGSVSKPLLPPTTGIGKEPSTQVYGITPDGTRFPVPETHDMVSTLFDIRLAKSYSDMAIVTILSSYVGLFFVLPKSWRISVFLILFAFWRLAYNAGIGWVLNEQSKNKTLTKWAASTKFFDKSNSQLHRLVRHDLITKLGKDYDFYNMPLEYNTWLVFREGVDLILMSDFTCYMMLVFSCYSAPSQPAFLVAARWLAGIVLFFFNLWVKLDAHRVVKDYAWYWGDFFFLEDLNLTFDGVFEMAPHPMYSIGYAGFYGFCLITASYTLFFASVAAHICQFIFLIMVENPHIEKTYGPPRAKKNRLESFSSGTALKGFENTEDGVALRAPLLIFKNFTITRTSDVLLLLLTVATILQAFASKNSYIWSFVAFFAALSWRFFHYVGLGYLLKRQSEDKMWTRIFLKFGCTAAQAYEEWQAIYNISTVMSYASLFVLVVRNFKSPLQLTYWPLRYIVGSMLGALQIWTSYSIYESIGDYGWFFGDFFYLKNTSTLTYSGIYRYLNNPERLFGIAGVWGLALITNSFSVALIAFVWTFGGMAFIKFVEQPHMQKLYGDQLRRDAGITKTIKHVAKVPSPFESHIKQFQGSVDKVLSETSNAVEAFLEQAKPKITGATKKVKETRVLLKEYPARLTIVHVSDEIHVNMALYGLRILTPSSQDITGNGLKFELGTPLEIEWTADTKHSNKDWIGLYRLTDNPSTDVTRVSSRGKWSAVHKDGYKNHNDSIISIGEDGNSGLVRFSGSILAWETGVYEFRYHHDGKHNVLSSSQPFEIVASKVPIGDDAASLAEKLISLVKLCVAGTDCQASESSTDPWDIEDETVLKRLSYAIKEKYGVDLVSSVLLADRTPMNLAVRLITIHQAVQPLAG